MKNQLAALEIAPYSSFSATKAIELENQGKILRVLCPKMQGRIQNILKDPNHNAQSFVAKSENRLYISLISLAGEKERMRAFHLIRRCQVGDSVDIRNLPLPIQQILQPNCPRKTNFLQLIALGGLSGTIIGILSMALSVMAIAAVELALNIAFDEFSGMQITAVSFVIFTVLGCIGATLILSRRMSQ